MPTRGRPTKLTPDRQRRIVEALLAGGSAESAARQGGITPSTYKLWVSRGRRALETAHAAGKIERISDDPAGERVSAKVERVARETAAIVPVEERDYSAFSAAVGAALDLWELGMVAIIQRAAQGQDYRRTRTKRKDEIVGHREDGTAIVQSIVIDETIDEGRTFDWRAAQAALRMRLPQYRETVAVEHSLSAEQTGALLSKAVEGILQDLGVKPRKNLGAVVHKHLMLVADEAEETG